MYKTKITLLMAASLNGFINRNDKEQVTAWTSPEDKSMLYSEIKSSDALIMGRKSFFRFYSKLMSGPIYVLTNDKQLLNMKANQIIYTNETPEQIIKNCQSQNIKSALLLGGAKTNTAFLQKKLIDEIKITIEPRLFGNGLPFLTDCEIDEKLELISVKKVNQKGTLFLHYKILKEKFR